MYRGVTTKRGLGGMLNSTYVFDAAKQIELTDLSRQKFDKNTAELVLPSFKKYRITPIFPELANLALDSEFGSLISTPALTLPNPHLDVDPTFIFFNLTPEVNTSRRSDHDARYKVSWGPIVISSIVSGDVGVNEAASWSKKSGPSALTAIPSKVLRDFSLFSNLDLYFSTANSTNLARKLGSQPVPGSLFSNSIQATLASAVPTSQISNAATPLTEVFNFGEANVGGEAVIETNVVEVLGVYLNATNDIPTQITSDYSFRLTSEWLGLWQFFTRSGEDLVNQSINSEEVGTKVNMLRLLLAVEQQKKVSSLLA